MGKNNFFILFYWLLVGIKNKAECIKSILKVNINFN